MTVQEILTESAERGIRLVGCGDRLRYEAPPGAMTPTFRDRLEAQKPALLAVLWRLEAMRASVGKLPVVVARLEATGGPGRCFSCGESLEHPDGYGRCVPCDVAADVFYSTRRRDADDWTVCA
jgi:hypothetical protein